MKVKKTRGYDAYMELRGHAIVSEALLLAVRKHMLTEFAQHAGTVGVSPKNQNASQILDGSYMVVKYCLAEIKKIDAMQNAVLRNVERLTGKRLFDELGALTYGMGPNDPKAIGIGMALSTIDDAYGIMPTKLTRKRK